MLKGARVKALLGRKIGMTQLFDENGNVSRVTILEAGPCVVTQVKTGAKDGYEAVQIGFGKDKNAAKPQIGHYSKDGATPKYFKEVRMDDVVGDVEAVEGEDAVKVGSELN